MSERDYTFWIEAPGELLNENFTSLLNMVGHSADTMREKIMVQDIGEVYAYRVPEHSLITFVKKSDYARKFRVFVREGCGSIRKYHNFHGRIDVAELRARQLKLASTIMRASEIRDRSTQKK